MSNIQNNQQKDPVLEKIQSGFSLLNQNMDLGNHILISKSVFQGGIKQLDDSFQLQRSMIEVLQKELESKKTEASPPKIKP